MKDDVDLRGAPTKLKDIMNKPGTFVDGIRMKEYVVKDIPAFSGKLLPEFDKRRNIKDMFGKKPSLQHAQSSLAYGSADELSNGAAGQTTAPGDIREEPTDATKGAENPTTSTETPFGSQAQPSRATSPEKKRKASETTPASSKRAKNSKTTNEKVVDKGQQSLKGFFASRPSTKSLPVNTSVVKETDGTDNAAADSSEAGKTGSGTTTQ